MYALFIAVILGIVEGLTEFIPVSSTGHMIIVGDMLGFSGPKASAFEVFIQLGAILAVFLVYRTRFTDMLKRKNWFRKDGLSLVHIAIGMVPAMGIGYITHKLIKTYLFSNGTVMIGLVIGGLFMLYAERKKPAYTAKTVDDVTYEQAFKIGLFQILSLWPGFSRSGSTIAGGLLSGVSRRAATDFTFIMALPIMIIACLYDFLKIYSVLSAADILVFAVGFIVAFVAGLLSILMFLKFVKRFTLVPFALYRFGIALLAFIYFVVLGY